MKKNDLKYSSIPKSVKNVRVYGYFILITSFLCFVLLPISVGVANVIFCGLNMWGSSHSCVGLNKLLFWAVSALFIAYPVAALNIGFKSIKMIIDPFKLNIFSLILMGVVGITGVAMMLQTILHPTGSGVISLFVPLVLLVLPMMYLLMWRREYEEWYKKQNAKSRRNSKS